MNPTVTRDAPLPALGGLMVGQADRQGSMAGRGSSALSPQPGWTRLSWADQFSRSSDEVRLKLREVGQIDIQIGVQIPP